MSKISMGRKTENFDYPSNLNQSANWFEGCWSEEEEGNPKNIYHRDHPDCRKEVDCHLIGPEQSNPVREPPCKRSKCSRKRKARCGLGDDLIMCRISYLLNSHASQTRGSDCDDTSEACSDDEEGRSPYFLLPSDSGMTLPPVLPSVSASSCRSPVGEVLSAVGVEEVEALDAANGGPAAGQCQFACIASALSLSSSIRLSSSNNYRPDLELRQLALHVIENNMELYRDFLTVPGGRTRAQSGEGGTGVDPTAYLRAMSSPSCDGDAVTLQALCDALKITIRVVKPVDANSYEERREMKRLHTEASLVSVSSCSDEGDGSSVSEDDSLSLAPSFADELDASSASTSSNVSDLSLSWQRRPGRGVVHQRLHVSEEMRPRPLNIVDSRLKQVQNKVRGRLIWLSQVGGEAHYRFLRPTKTESDATDSPWFLNQRELNAAQLSRQKRLQRIRSFCTFRDDYVHRTCSQPAPKKPLIVSTATRRGAGKRQVRPVVRTNISHEHWSVRTYSTL